MSSGWFDHTEPSLSTSLQGKQGVQGAYALVRGGSSTSNLIESSRNIITEIARCVGFCHMGSGLVVIPINMKPTHKHISVTRVLLSYYALPDVHTINSNKQPQTIKLVNICLCI